MGGCDMCLSVLMRMRQPARLQSRHGGPELVTEGSTLSVEPGFVHRAFLLCSACCHLDRTAAAVRVVTFIRGALRRRLPPLDTQFSTARDPFGTGGPPRRDTASHAEFTPSCQAPCSHGDDPCSTSLDLAASALTAKPPGFPQSPHATSNRPAGTPSTGSARSAVRGPVNARASHRSSRGCCRDSVTAVTPGRHFETLLALRHARG